MNPTMTILLIDDNTSDLFTLEQLLERDGRLFLRASNGVEGLKTALNQNIDLIILDVKIPGTDDLEITQLLKSDKRTKDIPVIFASAKNKEHTSVIPLYDEGVVDYFNKPIDPELIKAKVSVLLKIQFQKRELTEKSQALEKAEAHIKHLHDEGRKNLSQLEQVKKELELFSYSVSHDLRAPIRSLLGFSEILQEDLKDNTKPEVLSHLEKILRNANKMNRMIDELQELSRVGNKEMTKSMLNMEEIVRSVVSNVAGSNTSIVIHEILPAPADRALITQVWKNLSSNAIKYSSKKATPIVEIGSQKRDDEIQYYIKDNGAGFEMQYAEKLFGVFQRMHRQTEFEGLGIGLAIAQKIISRHGGRIWAEAKVNEGATFYFVLPA
jgi:two-component system, sensor histidine kinase and response regulator